MKVKYLLRILSKQLKSISDTPDLDCEILLCFVLKKSKEWLYINLDKELTEKQVGEFGKLLARRKMNEPIAYIVGKKNFFGMEFDVDDRVLIPRPETEMMVSEVLSMKYPVFSIVDVGTGSGCIAISLAKNLKKAKIWAIDASKKALEVAKKNVKKHKIEKQVKLLHGNLLKPLGNNKVDIICANLPYLTIEQLGLTEKDVKDYEPEIALACEKTEIDLYKKLLKMTPKYLNKNGLILLEIDPIFKIKLLIFVKQIIPKAKIKIKKDLAGKERLMIIKL